MITLVLKQKDVLTFQRALALVPCERCEKIIDDERAIQPERGWFRDNGGRMWLA